MFCGWVKVGGGTLGSPLCSGEDKVLDFGLSGPEALHGLVKLANLDLVGNPRLLCLLERMLRWKFSVTHFPGKKNRIPVALSRDPWDELAALVVLDAEFHTEEEIQETEGLKGAVVTSVLGVVLS